MSVEMVRRLMRLRGIGASSAWLFVTEFFAWRQFRNRREVGALAGLALTPHQSGASRCEPGISKSGNRLVRTMAIEIAWGWLLTSRRARSRSMPVHWAEATWWAWPTTMSIRYRTGTTLSSSINTIPAYSSRCPLRWCCRE